MGHVVASLGVVVIALALRYWYLLVIAGLLALCGVQQMRIANAHAQLAKVQQQYAEASRKAEADARAEETRRQAIVDKEASDAQARIVQLEADAASARDSAERLRAAVSAAVSGARKGAKPASGGEGKPGSDALDMLAKLYSESQDRAGEVALYADRLRIAGQACEATYDSLKAK
jgi:hypothetical protein